MPLRNILLIVIAVLFAGGTAYFVRNSSAPAPEVVAEPTPVLRILVAKNDIPMGNFVRAGNDLEWRDWPEASLLPQHIKEGSDNEQNYDGAVARRPFRANEPIIANELIKPGAGGFLAAVLEPGKRAVGVAVSATSGASGFIFPGDHVDMLLTHRVKTRATPTTNEEDNIVTETFVENVRVVAVDQMMDNPENKAILAKTVTVEVSPDQAERIGVAEDLGKISLTLRSLANQPANADKDSKTAEGGPLEPMGSQDYVSTISGDHAAPQGKGFTQGGDISRVLGRGSSGAPRILVIRGDTSEEREFMEGGE